ncbi:MAG: GxxExxY protein [Chitinophagaceae bacterium]
MTHNEIVKIILDEAFYIHRKLGPGLLESVYSYYLEYRLKKAGLNVRRQVPIPVILEGIKLECGYRADLVVENMVLIEIKCVDALIDIHFAQTLTYLKFLDLRLGVILNFKTVFLKDGIRRIVNKLPVEY